MTNTRCATLKTLEKLMARLDVSPWYIVNTVDYENMASAKARAAFEQKYAMQMAESWRCLHDVSFEQMLDRLLEDKHVQSVLTEMHEYEGIIDDPIWRAISKRAIAKGYVNDMWLGHTLPNHNPDTCEMCRIEAKKHVNYIGQPGNL